MILKKIKDAPTLLKCRQVCSNWKSTVEPLLKEMCLSSLTKWEPFPQNLGQSCLHPTIKLKTNFQWTHPSLHISKEQNPTQFLHNPFPTGCVEFKPRILRQFPPRPKEMAMFKTLFRDYGLHLNAVVFTCVVLPLNSLKLALSHMENLKFLSVTMVSLHGISKRKLADIHSFLTDPRFRNWAGFPINLNPDLLTLPRHPNLEHLKVGVGYDVIPLLLLRNYSQQLISLESQLSIQTCANDPNPFEKLKKLKLIDNSLSLKLSTLDSSAFKNLEYFYVCRNPCKLHYWKELIGAVDDLPKSVVHIHFDVRVKEVNEEDQEFANWSVASFPFVKNLGIPYPRSELQAELVRNGVLMKFPNLEYLDFVLSDFTRKAQVVEDEWLWEACEKLKRIQIFKGRAQLFSKNRIN